MESDFYSDVVSTLYSYLDMKGTFHVEEIVLNAISQLVQDGKKKQCRLRKPLLCFVL